MENNSKRYAAVILLDAENAILLQQKTLDAPHHPGMWGMFGGGIEEGETPLAAARREMQEELELDLLPENLYSVGEYTFPDAHITIFWAKVPVDKALPLHEGRGMGYFTQEEIQHLHAQPNDQKVLLDFLNTRPSMG